MPIAIALLVWALTGCRAVDRAATAVERGVDRIAAAVERAQVDGAEALDGVRETREELGRAVGVGVWVGGAIAAVVLVLAGIVLWHKLPWVTRRRHEATLRRVLPKVLRELDPRRATG